MLPKDHPKVHRSSDTFDDKSKCAGFSRAWFSLNISAYNSKSKGLNQIWLLGGGVMEQALLAHGFQIVSNNNLIGNTISWKKALFWRFFECENSNNSNFAPILLEHVTNVNLHMLCKNLEVWSKP